MSQAVRLPDGSEQDPSGRRWCDGPCGRLLPLTSDYFDYTGERRWFTKKCKRCRSVRKSERHRKPTIRARKLQYLRAYFQRVGKDRQREKRAAARRRP